MTTAAADTEPGTEEWVYAGVRVGSNWKRVCAWIDPGGNTLRFAERSAHFSIGARYEARVTRAGEGVTLHGTPKFVKAADRTDPAVGEYDAADRIARIHLARRAAERKDALQPAERLAFKVASEQLGRRENPGSNTTAALLLTIERLISEIQVGTASELRDALQPLEEIAAKFSSTTDLDALAAFVLRRIHDAYWRTRPVRR